MELLSKDHRIIEKSRMEFQPFGRTPDGKRVDDVSGVSMRGHIACLEEIVSRKLGQEAAAEAVKELVRLLNERIPDPSYHVTPEFLKNPWNSYSHEFAVFLPSFSSTLAGDPDFHIKAGRRLVQPMIQTLGRPFSVQQIFRMIAYFGNKYAKAIRFEGIQIEDKHAIIRVTYSENSLRQFGKYQKGCISEICETIKAGFSTVPQAVHGLLPATVKDRACVANGDPFCEYDITWESEERSRFAWMAATGVIIMLTFVILRFVDPLASLTESLLLSLIPAAVLGHLHRRIVLGRELRRQSEIIDEQARTTDTRHEELREAYLEQQQRTADLQRKVSELTLLHKTGLLLTSNRDREELISLALGTLIKGLGFDRGMLSFYESRSRVLKSAWIIGVGEETARPVPGFEVPVKDAHSVEGAVVIRGQPLLVKDVTEFPTTSSELVRFIETKAFVAVPLKVKDRILGLIIVGRVGDDPLSEADLEVMLTFANQLAVGIDNARAYREIEELNLGLESKVRQRTAELEEANDRLRELDNLKSQFLAHVSHELRTPLTSIQGFADNLLDQLGGPLTDKQTQNLKRITANTGRLHRMIANLLDQAQIEAGKFQLSLGDVQLGQLVEDVIEHMQPLAQAKQQSLELLCPEPQLTLWADADKLRQVVTNLVDNAIKYSPLKGRIRITVGQEQGGQAKLSVIDSGHGIPRDSLAKIFDAFYRVKTEQKRGVKGFGLGLSIVKTLVELHGGQVTIESEEGEGTSFHVTLPLSQRAIAKSDEVVIKIRRILVVDDDPDIRQFLIDRLEGAGYELKAAKTGREAIALISTEVFDGAILDIGLPEGDGIEVLQYLRCRNPHTPVLMITAAEARERALWAVESGAQAYLLKPFNASQFERAILQCFGKSTADEVEAQ
jgi:signal transduction histidine kinase/ActR/RegA family two-component response regulator